MSIVPSAPNDPVFFLHHCNVDRLWAQWQKDNPNEDYVPIAGAAPGHNLDDNMTLFGASPRQSLDIYDLCYIYV